MNGYTGNKFPLIEGVGCEARGAKFPFFEGVDAGGRRGSLKGSRLRVALLTLTLIAATTAIHAATINVSGGGSALQTAISNANEGDTLLVAPGTYSPITSNNKAITIESTGGAEVTIINGGNSQRCATLGTTTSHTNTVLAGFTLTNGYTSAYGGGSWGGTLNNCTLTGNSANNGGGSYYGTLNNCTLAGNRATQYGGGSYYGTLNNCTLAGNRATYYGGGSYYGTLNNCTLTGNTADSSGGGSCFGTLNNCTLAGNRATQYGGGSYGGTLNNCTLTGNTADSSGGGSYYGTLNNCIVWGNTAAGGSSHNYYSSTFRYSCTTPAPSGTYNGGGNTTQNPLFADAANGDFRLQSNSPCIDKGNNSYVIGDFDLDGNWRIVGGTVDMGAYEYNPLGGAVNAPELGWRTGGDAPWFVQSAVTHGGPYATQSGEIGDNQASWIETTVTEAGTLSFWWKVSSEADTWPSGDWLICTTNGVEALRISGEVGWEQQVLEFAGGETTIRWTYAKDRALSAGSDCGWLDEVVWIPTYTVTFDGNGGTPEVQTMTVTKGSPYGELPEVDARTGYDFAGWFTAPTGGEQVTSATTVEQLLPHTLYAHWALNLGSAVDAPELDWQTGGDAEWFAQDNVTHDGPYAAQSGDIGDLEESWIETAVTGAGTLSFWWKVSNGTEEGWDWLVCSTNGAEAFKISGEAGWEQRTLRFTGDEAVTVRWTYIKDKAYSDGADCGWLAEVAWTPSETQTTPVPVPYAWLDAHYGVNGGDYEAVANGKDPNNGYYVWELYVIGFANPSDPDNRFTARIEMEGDKPAVTWDPHLRDGTRAYMLLAKPSLDAAEWTPVDPNDIPEGMRFFKVRVGMP
ncbi:MAG: InlB B-repeat-containing protein [Kiritimatiellaeota bacterium]|nr:InlB B-repeat-containing protein [Kiritimatiellota bacterium]